MEDIDAKLASLKSLKNEMKQWKIDEAKKERGIKEEPKEDEDVLAAAMKKLKVK